MHRESGSCRDRLAVGSTANLRLLALLASDSQLASPLQEAALVQVGLPASTAAPDMQHFGIAKKRQTASGQAQAHKGPVLS